MGSDSEEVPLSMSSLFEGIAIHIAVARPSTFEKIVRDNKGTVASLKDADVVVTAKTCKSFLPKKKYVTRTWLQESVREGEVAPYSPHLLNSQPSSSQDADKSESCSSEDEPVNQKNTKKKSSPKKEDAVVKRQPKKRLHVALDENSDSSTLIPIIKQLGGSSHKIIQRIRDRANVTALVSAGLCLSLESALASLYKIPVVSESWLYASLEKGSWADLGPHILMSSERSNNHPFKDMVIYLHGRKPKSTNFTGIELIISAGGGETTSRLSNANVIVAFSHFDPDTTTKPIVKPDWLLSCAHSLQHLSVEDYYYSEGSSSDSSSGCSSSSSSSAPTRKTAKKATRKKAAKKPSKKAAKKKNQPAEDSSDSSAKSPSPSRAGRRKKVRKGTSSPVKATNDSDSSDDSMPVKPTRKNARKPAAKKSPTKPKTASPTKKSQSPTKETVVNKRTKARKASPPDNESDKKPARKISTKKKADSDSEVSEDVTKAEKKLPNRKVIRKATSSEDDSESVPKNKEKRKQPSPTKQDGKRSKVEAEEELPKVVGKQVNRFSDASSVEVELALGTSPKRSNSPLLEPSNPNDDYVSDDLCDSNSPSQFSGISLDDYDITV